MGVNTKKFGKHAWVVLHTVASFVDWLYENTKDTKQRQQIECYTNQFMLVFGMILPCIYCRVSYRKFASCRETLQYRRNMFSNPKGVQKLYYHIHNCVNAKLYHQELSQSHDRKQIKQNWERKLISINTLFDTYKPDDITKPMFWKHFTMFMGYVMCDYDTNRAPHILRFMEMLQSMLSIQQKSNQKIHMIYEKFTNVCNTWKKQMTTFHYKLDLNNRFDLVWSIKHGMIQEKWSLIQSPQQLQSLCTKAIVSCK